MKPITKIMDESPLPTHRTEAEAHAEKLIFLAHEGTNWAVWGGERRVKYWDALSDRVRAATYAGPDLNYWWESISHFLDTRPTSPEHRKEIIQAVSCDTINQREILKALRNQANILVMRIRVNIEHYRSTQEDK